MRFHLGRPLGAMIAIAVLSGAAAMVRPRAVHSDLTLWTFADTHRDAYLPLTGRFQNQSGRSVDIHLISPFALHTRLMSLFMSGASGEVLPDAVEIDLGSIGRYFRPPVGQVGFLPLNNYLENTGFREINSLDDAGQAGWHARLRGDGRIYRFDGARWLSDPSRARPDAWIDRILPSRLALWSKDGVVFGIPHDVHPTLLCYRADLFGQAGVAIESPKTWDDFQEKCLQFQQYWAARGYPRRHAMELYESLSDHLMTMLLQRHVNLIDAQNRVHLTDARVAETISFYAQLVAGPRRIAAEAGTGTGLWVNDLREGNLCAAIAPDWRLELLKKFAPDLSGKMRVMPLPKFDPSDAPASTWSGTMIGIPRQCKNPDLAWKLIEFYYLSPAALDARIQKSGILPPLPEAWSGPVYGQADPFFGGRRIYAMYAQLATQVPPRNTSFATPYAQSTLGVVMSYAVSYVRRHGGADGLPAYVQGLLTIAQRDLERRIDKLSFTQE